MLIIQIALPLLWLSLAEAKKQVGESPSYEQMRDSLINKLMRLCGETQSISLPQCEPKMIENDKRSGNYRPNYNYTKQTIYMMAVYDADKDGRLTKNQLSLMAIDIINGDISNQKIRNKINDIQSSSLSASKPVSTQNQQL